MELKIEAYCHHCPEFEANVIKTEKQITDYEDDILVQTNIYCKHRNRCRRLMEYLSDQLPLDPRKRKE